jgi:HEAT repeat protein
MTTDAARRQLIALALLLSAGCSSHEEQTIAALRDVDPQVRRSAVRALAAYHGRSKTATLSLLAPLEDQDKSVRVTAALEVLKLDAKNARSQAILMDALRDGQGPVFLEIGQSGDKASWAVPMLVSLLADRRAPIRALAAQTIGEIGVADDRVEPALRRGLRDESAAVRKACEKAFKSLGNQVPATPP